MFTHERPKSELTSLCPSVLPAAPAQAGPSSSASTIIDKKGKGKARASSATIQDEPAETKKEKKARLRSEAVAALSQSQVRRVLHTLERLLPVLRCSRLFRGYHLRRIFPPSRKPLSSLLPSSPRPFLPTTARPTPFASAPDG